ncbi:hypothetical protein [Haloarchaeobius iranensis]|uniref:Uncharacterized protein n=1 Tax=Haloarchaeobius iranensis TaxID=996166 RepID=A0A1G9UY04_9EURY|nr:hypothetical protein [Haloarchaeobius iranensis]SDM64679.1 hypothetical protein SAMN05192554_10567 [Haloarchaeobius iranensis]
MEYLPALREYCEFGPERVYMLVALARSKENEGRDPDGPSAIRKVVRDADGLDRAVAELDHAVSRFDATYRLYLTANARDTQQALFALRRSMDDWLEARLNGSEDVLRKFGRVDSEFKSTLQSDGCRDETNFVFDLDDATAADADALEADLRERTTVQLRRETPNGFHLVTAPFDYNALATDLEYELKTDGLVFVSYLGE